MSAVPRVSVVLPTFNRAQLLPRSIGSVLGQTLADLELIVVDDGSTDDVRAVVESFRDPRVRYLRRPKRGGPAAARNAGVREARGQWLAFQDSDDEWRPDKLTLQLEALQRAGPTFAMSICGLLRYGPRLQAYLVEPGVDPPAVTHDIALANPTRYVHTQCWLVRRDAMLAAGGFDETLFLWDDWDMLIRLTRHQPACTLAMPLAISHKSPDSITSTNPDWATPLRHIIEKHRVDLSRKPAIASLLWYLHARVLCLQARIPEARASLLNSLRARPARLKSWLLLGATLLGAGLTRTILRETLRPPGAPTG